MQIMVVDDQAVVADCLATIITDAGFDVVTLSDPRTALAQFQLDPDSWGIVITDQRMPGLTGDALVRSMRARRPDLPIILCSGNVVDARAQYASDLAIDAFLEKPYDIDAAVEVVRSVIRRERDEASRRGNGSALGGFDMESVTYLLGATADERLARLVSTLEAIDEGLQIIAADWRYLYINEAAVRPRRREGLVRAAHRAS